MEDSDLTVELRPYSRPKVERIALSEARLGDGSFDQTDLETDSS